MPDDSDQISLNYSIPKNQLPYFTDRYGFIINEKTTIKNENTAQISQKWHDAFLSQNIKQSIKAKKLIFKGVPIFLKYKAWSFFIKTKKIIDYSNLKDKKCKYEHQIHVDIQRTFRQHSLFADEYGLGQCRLFHVLVSFANHNTRIGYCQGMSSIAAILLMYFPEEESFFILDELISLNKIECLFDKNLSLLPKILHKQALIFEEVIPEIYRHLLRNNIDFSIFLFGWFLTLFSRFKIQLTLRIWDLFLYFDFDILFLVSCGILKSVRNKILNLKNEKLIHFVSNLEDFNFDVDDVLRNVKKYYFSYDMSKFE
ncbi:hypothetical protein GVAV_001792 [Gurleya vavrai]